VSGHDTFEMNKQDQNGLLLIKCPKCNKRHRARYLVDEIPIELAGKFSCCGENYFLEIAVWSQVKSKNVRHLSIIKDLPK